MGIGSLPPGFRFHPTDVELVKYYLKRKLLGKGRFTDLISEVSIYKHAPWDLPDKSCMITEDRKWYFFCPREKKGKNGSRVSRGNEIGYWKPTGKDRYVVHNNATVGMIKTLVFYIGRAPSRERTDWVMHEYRIEDKELADKGIVQDSYVLCTIFHKDGPGPKNGAQYGAPFNEEDWSDEDKEEVMNATGSMPAILTEENDITDESNITEQSGSRKGTPLNEEDRKYEDMKNATISISAPLTEEYAMADQIKVTEGNLNLKDHQGILSSKKDDTFNDLTDFMDFSDESFFELMNFL